MSGDNEFLIGIILFFILFVVSVWTVIVHGWAGLLFVAIVIIIFILLGALFTSN